MSPPRPGTAGAGRGGTLAAGTGGDSGGASSSGGQRSPPSRRRPRRISLLLPADVALVSELVGSVSLPYDVAEEVVLAGEPRFLVAAAVVADVSLFLVASHVSGVLLLAAAAVVVLHVQLDVGAAVPSPAYRNSCCICCCRFR